MLDMSLDAVELLVWARSEDIAANGKLFWCAVGGESSPGFPTKNSWELPKPGDDTAPIPMDKDGDTGLKADFAADELIAEVLAESSLGWSSAASLYDAR